LAWKQGQRETKFANFFAGFCKNKKSRPTRPAQTDCNISSQETIKRRKRAGVSSEREKAAKDVLIMSRFFAAGQAGERAGGDGSVYPEDARTNKHSQVVAAGGVRALREPFAGQCG
jgi:hypothetical protein